MEIFWKLFSINFYHCKIKTFHFFSMMFVQTVKLTYVVLICLINKFLFRISFFQNLSHFWRIIWAICLFYFHECFVSIVKRILSWLVIIMHQLKFLKGWHRIRRQNPLFPQFHFHMFILRNLINTVIFVL